MGTVRAGDGPGARGVWALWRSAPGAAPPPGGRGEGASPGLAGEYRAVVPQPTTGAPWAWGGGGGAAVSW